MTRPFIPFPIFPPYSHWRPNRETSFPGNLQVSARLSEVSQLSRPFISTWYVDRFINWSAHNWSPLNPHRKYNICIHGLEKMLNWSFANDLCLLDWTRTDFESYSDFIRSPTSDWVAPGKQTRFQGSPAMDFRDWPINPNWKLFQSDRSAESSNEIGENVWKREIRCVKQFMDFYLKDVSANRENVASEKLESLVFKVPVSRGSISDEVMEWMLVILPSLPLSTHHSHLIAMYLTIARYSVRHMWHVLGDASSPGRVDQFSRDAQGVWLETHPKNGVSTALPPAFGRVFERYLAYLNIDVRQPLPALSLFPKEDSAGAYDLRALWRMTCAIREKLADMAQASENPTITQASENIRRLTAALVSSRSISDA